MSKSERVAAYVESLETPVGGHHRCYAGFFECFNAGKYYEAHDVLEQLWLETFDSDRRFYQGLIQLAGAFVHLQKQHERPRHPTDGRRLRPASRLFQLAEEKLTPYASFHLDLDVGDALSLCRGMRDRIERSGFEINPWNPDVPLLLGFRA